MKFRNLVLMGFAAMGIAACSNSDENGIDAENPQGGDSWASFVINLPKASTATRADSDHGTEPGITNEQKISSVRVVLYDENATQVQYAFDYNIVTDGDKEVSGDVASPSTKAKFTTKAKMVKRANYKTLVLVNPLQEVKNLTNPGRSILDFQKETAKSVDNLTDKGFFMSNDQGLVTLLQSRLKETADAAEASVTALPVKVDRAVAKILVTAPEDGVTTIEGSGDKVENFTWALDVTNKTTYWMRNLAPIADGKDEVVANPDEMSVVATPRFMRYAKDPNYNKEYNTIEAAKKDFNYLENSPQVFTKMFGEFDYALENTMDQARQMQNQTTRVVLRANYIPNGVGAGDNWFSYLGVIMNEASFMQLFKLAVTDKDLNVTGLDGKEIALPESFRDDMKEVLALELVTLEGEDNSTVKLPEESFVSNNLKFYKDGINYFPVLIRHFGDDLVPAVGGYGRYGIVRNNVYKLNIQQIKSPGEPIVPPIDPEDPDDKENSYVAFDVEVLPWVVREQNVIID